MIVVESTAEEYDALFCKDNIFYNTGVFNAFNKNKCDRLYYLIFKDTKVRLGMIAGAKGNSLFCPFSAPFGGFSFVDEKIAIRHIEEAVDVLNIFCRTNDIENLSITLPPTFYNESLVTKSQHVLCQKGFSLECIDLNYVFYLKKIVDNYKTDVISRNGRKNLTIALSRKMQFEVGEGEQGLKEAYKIIEYNRKVKGFHLLMSEKDILNTSKIVKMDSFFVRFEGQAIASAIVYHVTDEILQVIYWGDLPEFSSNKTMNFLAYKVFEHYYLKGYGLIDVGTAMLDDKPNYGLCDFKESIGCDIQPKCTFLQHYSK